jgi:Ca2+:H+ antiporter
LSSSARWLFGAEGWPYLLVPAIPAAVVLEFTHASDLAIFVASAIGR